MNHEKIMNYFRGNFKNPSKPERDPMRKELEGGPRRLQPKTSRLADRRGGLWHFFQK